MKTGKSIVELAQELQSLSEKKKDIVTDTRNVEMQVIDEKPILDVKGQGFFDIRKNAHRQIGDRINVPAKYYDRMLEDAPELLATNVNHWLQHKPENRMVRTLDNHARAFLSDRYRIIDNEDVAEMALPILMGQDSIEIVSCDVTEQRMYIKALFPRVEGEVKKGDAVQSGIVISNSEIGAGSFSVQPLVYRLVCTNGMIANDYGKRAYHTGQRLGEGQEAYELFRDDTLKAADQALMMKMRDIINGAMDQSKFDLILSRMKEAAETDPIQNPVKAAEIVRKRFSLTEGEGNSFLENLLRDGDRTAWGTLNAVTQIANTTDDYDRATELEAIGGRILDLNPRDWREIAEAA